MSEKDIRALLEYETNRGKIRQLSEKEIKEFHKKFNETLEQPPALAFPPPLKVV